MALDGGFSPCRRPTASLHCRHRDSLLWLVAGLYDYLWDREKFAERHPPRPAVGRGSGSGQWDSASSLDRLDPDPHRERYGADNYGHHHHDWGDYGHHDDWGGHHGSDWDGGGFDGGHHGGPDY